MEIAIIGLGLMGGSFGLAVKKNLLGVKIFGHDADNTHGQQALKLNLVDELATLEEAMQKEVIILATPVDVCISILQKHDADNALQTIIDLGSTKEKISNSLSGEKRRLLIAAHPMTGTEYSGPTAAKEDLYDKSTVVLCDLEKSGKHQIDVAKKIFSSIGMKIIEMNSDKHDLHACYISHLPHIISFSLANTVLSKENPQDILSMAAGGFRDMSRLAKSRPDLWTQIFRQNSSNLLKSIELFEYNLSELKSLIQSGDWQTLQQKLEKANELHLIFK